MPNNELPQRDLSTGPLVQRWTALTEPARRWGVAPTPSAGRHHTEGA